MVVKTYTFVGKSANCDLTANWALLKSVAGQRLYTIQRRRPFSATVRLDVEKKFPYFLFFTWLSIIRNQEFRL